MARSTIVSLVGIGYVLAVALWFALESHAAAAYLPSYSYAADMISDLGVSYVYTGDVHWLGYSPRAPLMNFNFFATGALYAALQWFLLYGTEGDSTVDRRLRMARAIISFLFMLGLMLVGTVHGGPKEHRNGMIAWHQLGATLSIVGGNVCSILAGVSNTQIKPLTTSLAYRYACLFLGTIGNISAFALLGLTPHAIAGTVERVAVYTVFAWELLTGFYLLLTSEEEPQKLKTR